MLLRRALRCALFAIVTVAIWTLSRPAFAMPAPLCDDRGATTLAPPPTLLAPLEVLSPAPPLPCDDADLGVGPTLDAGHGPHPFPPSQGDPALVTSAAPLATPPGEPLASPPPDAPSTEGVQYRIERPPR